MSGFESDPSLELDALLDPARLAAAWQVARARALADAMVAGAVEPVVRDARADDTVPMAAPEPVAVVPTRLSVALPVALAHRHVLDELERLLAARPGLPATARLVLNAPLAQLAAALDPLDAAAAEAALDALEDVVQAVLSVARWPGGREQED